MNAGNEDQFLTHLEALRRTLLKCLAVTALLYPVGYYLSASLIDALARWSFSDSFGKLHFFSPMEVFLVRLKLGAVLSLMLAYPWNVYQIWSFLIPGLYRRERRLLGAWILGSSVLFFGGIAFCVFEILPLLMRFALGFASDSLEPVIGLASFLNLSGWLSLAFGVMFQFPVCVLLAVNFGLVSTAALRRNRPYVVTAILVVSAILTPPDVISQLLLTVPTWLLFELGLFLSSRIESKGKSI